MNKEELISKCLLSFVSLKKLDERNLPIGMASGCIVKYNNKHFLLTVFHAVGDQEKWGLEIKYEHSTGMKTYLLGGFLFLKKVNLKSMSFEDVDLAIKELDKTVIPYYQDISHDGKGIVIKESPKQVSEIDLAIKPIHGGDRKYYFAGLTRPILMSYDNRYILEQQLTLEKDLTFIGEDSDGEVYTFKLSRLHPGHEEYQGCSGSPIFDDKGNIVALVIRGDTSKNEIYGISLNRYKIALDIEAGLIK